MSHYYDKTPEVKHDRAKIEEVIRDVKLRFYTDAGVFSKQSVDFGSKLLIKTMELSGAASILDIGCGYGPMGLYAAKLCPTAKVTMMDINERAVALARENAQLNKIDTVEIMQSDLYEAVKNRRFDVILSNPPIRAGKETVHRIFEEAVDHLHPGGVLYIVIQKKQGAPSAWAKLESLFSRVEEVDKDKGYRIFRAVID